MEWHIDAHWRKKFKCMYKISIWCGIKEPVAFLGKSNNKILLNSLSLRVMLLSPHAMGTISVILPLYYEKSVLTPSRFVCRLVHNPRLDHVRRGPHYGANEPVNMNRAEITQPFIFYNIFPRAVTPITSSHSFEVPNANCLPFSKSCLTQWQSMEPMVRNGVTLTGDIC